MYDSMYWIASRTAERGTNEGVCDIHGMRRKKHVVN